MIAQLDAQYIRTRPAKAVKRLLSYLLFEGRPLTTRGRWINPLVLSNLRRLAKKPRKNCVSKPVFVVGTGRSGTTVCGVVLSMHKDIGFLNEPKAMWHTVNSNDDIVGNYSDNPGQYRLSAEDVDEQMEQTAQRLYSRYCHITGSRRVLDKYPEMIFRVAFIRRIFDDAKFLFLVRSPDATAGSIAAWSERHASRSGNTVSDWWGKDDRKWHSLISDVVAQDPEFADQASQLSNLENERDRAAVEWLFSMRAGLQAQSDMADMVMRIRYEDLVTHPQDTLTTIFNFCDLEDDPVCIGYAQAKLGTAREHPIEPFHPLIEDAIRNTAAQLGYDAAPIWTAPVNTP